MSKLVITGKEMQGRAPRTDGVTSQRGDKRKPGRPPLAVPRNRVLQLRITERDYQLIRHDAFKGEQTLSECAVSMMLDGRLAKLRKRGNAEIEAAQ